MSTDTPSSISYDEQVRYARRKFTAMAATFFLGTFNDNFFKQVALVMAVAAGMNDMQGYVVATFTAPFVILAAPAGWLSDRFSKSHVAVGAKALELAAMLFGAVGICFGNWWLIFTMLAIMGTQATIFSPALNGSLPELYPPEYVNKANGILRMLITIAILGGIALAGVMLDIDGTGLGGIPLGRMLVAGMVVVIAIIGLLTSFGIPHRPAANPTAPFPWFGPAHTIKDLVSTRRDPMMAVAIAANVFIWTTGSLQVLLINPLGIQQFMLSKTETSLLIVAELVGIAAGGMISGWLVKPGKWYRALPPSGLAMGGLMFLMPLTPSLPDAFREPALYVLIGAIGVAAGIFLIPLESCLQIRPAAARKGAILSAVNFIVFSGILLSGFISNWLNDLWTPTTSFRFLAEATLAVSLLLILLFRRYKQYQ